LGFAEGSRVRIQIHQRNLFERSIARFRLAVTTAAPPLAVVPDNLQPLLTKPSARRSADEETTLAQFYRDHLEQKVRMLEAQMPRLVSTLVLGEDDNARPTYVYRRGEYRAPAEAVQPGTPAVLPDLEVIGARPNRLHLADWLTSPHHPLVARVLVNRVWQRYF